MSTSVVNSADTTLTNVQGTEISPTITVTAENMLPSVVHNGSESLGQKSGGMSVTFCPSEHNDLKSSKESDYVNMELKQELSSDIVTPYATTHLVNEETHLVNEEVSHYDVINESELNGNINNANSDSPPSLPPRPDTLPVAAAHFPTPADLPTQPRACAGGVASLKPCQQPGRPMSPLRIIDHSEPDWEQMQLESGRQILIQGIPVGMSIKDVGICFEKEFLPEGDNFEDIKVNTTHREAVVTLRSKRVTNDLLKRSELGEQFLLQDNEVSLSPYKHAPSDIMKTYILGLTAETTVEDISKDAEHQCGIRPSDVIKGTRNEIALLCFDSTPDLPEVQFTIAKQTPEVNKWYFLPVERSKRVQVRGVAMGTTPEELKQYFETDLLSKDGAIDSIIYRDNLQDYIVTFIDIEDAETVVRQKIHTVNEAQLDVSSYYPCLDRDEEYLLKIPGPIKLKRLNKHMCRFLQTSTLYRKELEDIVDSHYGKVLWPDDKTDEYLCIQCNVDEKDRIGKLKIKKWERYSAGVVSQVCKMLSVHYKYFALEILTELKSGIRKLSVSNPESVLVCFEENKIAIAGEIKYVDELSEKVKMMINEMEENCDSLGQSLTKTVKLEVHEIELFKEARFHEHLKSVSTSLENQNVVVKGKRKMVNDAVMKVKELIKSLKKENIEGISMLARSLISMNETAMHIKGMMSESKVFAVWNVAEDGSLVMYSQSAEELKTAITTMKSALKSTTIKVDTRIANYLQRGDGKTFLKRVEKEYVGKVKLKVDREEVCIVSLDKLKHEIYEKIMKFLDSHSDVTEVLPLDPGVFRFIFSYKKNAIDKIVQQYKRLAVEIDIIDKRTRKGFMISGEKEHCKLAIVDLHTIVDTVARSDHDADWPMFNQFLRSSEGIKELNTIELSEKCVIRISADDSNVVYEKPKSSVLGECRIANCNIEVMEHDITEKVAEFIVNPTADAFMKHKHGLGLTLVDKGGYSIQKDCNDYIQGAPCLKDGDIFVGVAGCLPCRGIIHVVVPVWKGGSSNEKFILEYVVTRCLIEADTRNAATVAFPPVGAGRLGYPREVIAEIMMKAVKTYLTDNGTETFLRHVYICDIDRDMLCLHVKALEKGFGQTTVMMRELLESDEIDAKGSNNGGNDSNRITKEIVVGSITSQDTDVIVNSTNLKLDFRIGFTSRLIKEEGGEEILSDIKKKYADGIKLGEIAETTGGKLKCKAVFHGCLVKWDKGQGYADTVLKSFVQNCLSTANRRQFVSITFPVLGGGALEFPPDRVAKTMFNEIDAFEREFPLSSLKCVRISIMSQDEKSIKAFEEYKSHFGTKRQLSRFSDISSRQSCQVESVFTESYGTDYNTTIGNVTFSICQGDLTTATTAVIVNSVPDDLNMKTGKISRAIYDAAGKSIQLEANKHKQSFKKAELVMTSSGRLLCQKIIHIKARNGRSGWKKSVIKCLAEVEKARLNSVAFPALGTGGKGFSSAEMAKTMVEAFKDYILGENYQGYLRNVRIIVYETDMVHEFTREAKMSLENSQRRALLDETECPKMVFHIYTETPSGDTEVMRRIEDLHKEVNVPVPEAALVNMPDTEISRLKRIGETHGVYVFVSKESLVLSGFSHNVDLVKDKIQQEMNRK